MKALLFDATGTLIALREPVGEVYHRVALEFGVDLPAWRIEDAFRRIMQHAPERGVEGDTPPARKANEVLWWRERIRQTFQATDSTARFADFEGFAARLFDVYGHADAWQLCPGAQSMLDRLSDEGALLGLVSNFDHRLINLLEELEIKHYFKSITLPFEAGLCKPAAALFEGSAADLGVPLEALTYVGDDAGEVLRSISELGVQVIDVGTLPDLAALPDRLDRGTATLPHAK